MKISELIEKYGWGTLSNSDGACACGDASIGGINIEVNCHRSSVCEDHGYSCVHVWLNDDYTIRANKTELKKIANLVAKYIRSEYMTECAISFKKI